MPKVIATSDLHGILPEIEPCDVLIIAGDVCPDHPIGKSERYNLPDNGSDYQLEWLDTTFRGWLNTLEAGVVVGIAGNHDFVFERMKPAVQELHLPWRYLEDSGTTAEGLSIWGTPWVPGLPRWAFHQSDMGLKLRAESIPHDLDILVTHGPPFGILDFVAPMFGSVHVGDVALLQGIHRSKPKVTVCGHIHEQYGTHDFDFGRIYNVSLNDERYSSNYRDPVVLTEFLD